MLCDARDGWDGVKWEGGPRGGDMCIHRADSLRYTAETNNTGKQLYPNFLKKLVMLLKYRWSTVLSVSGIQSDPFYIFIFSGYFPL